jgi:hypothetical protein
MPKFFVPYCNDKPAAIEINGHRLVVLGCEKQELMHDLNLLGGDQVKEIFLSENLDIEPTSQELLINLAESVQGGVVFAPPGVSVKAMLSSLKAELPWLH